MKIGIGVTTYNRPKHLDLFINQGNKNTEGVRCYIANDSKDRRGIAYRKNECLKALQDCDYIFLFDDDCFPIKKGWAEYFIEVSRASGQQHFQYLKETPTIKKIKHFYSQDFEGGLHGDLPYINQYNNSAGCFMFLTKEVIQKVGGYNPAYGIYGFEHCGYSNRIHKAGLTPLGPYTCPAQASKYIYSMDLDHHLPFNKQVKHEPSMANEIQNVPTYVAMNHRIYQEDNLIYHPL